MKRQLDGKLLFSPKDLIAFLEGDFVAWMERRHAERLRGGTGAGFDYAPDEADAEDDLIKRKGLEHEGRVLELLRTRHGGCVEIAHDATATEQTLAAMRAGPPLIYQGCLTDADWHGYPDFLVRSEHPSDLGPWSYWPMDSKLARSARPYFLIQLCAYAEYLALAQGLRPRALGFIFGHGAEQTFDTERFFYFYRHLKDTFTHFQQDFDGSTTPDPALEAGFGRWETAALQILEQRDDLRLVARITRSQIKRLRDAAIATAAALADSHGAVRRVSAEILERLRRQARLQIASRGRERPVHETLPHPPDQRAGLAALPPASEGDVFLDLEGNPLAENGLEYLFGTVTAAADTAEFHDWWAHDEPAEKIAFERVVDWIVERRRRDPAMHVYHYAPYEVTALKRLMGKYATREDEIDDLLRGKVFVDLYAVTRTGVAIGTRGYSLKDIEVLFSPPRAAGVTDAESSVTEYHRWMESGEPGDWRQSPILGAIRDYNREDCESTWRLASWLRERQAEAGLQYIPPPDAEPEAAPPEPRPGEDLAAQLLLRADAEPDGEPARITRLVAWLLGYHRREDKPMWWRYFTRAEASAEELIDDADCLANVTRTARTPIPIKRSQLIEYAFDPEQDTKLQAGDHVYLLFGDEPEQHQIETFDADRGRLEIKFGPSRTIPAACHIIPNEEVPWHKLRDAVVRFVERWAAGDRATYQALDDLLQRRAPRLTPARAGALLPDEARFPEDLTALVRSLDATTLCIQGPPGAGKTHNAAAVIVALAGTGARIGVSSNSHKAVVNLLTAIAVESRRQKKAVPIYKALGQDEDPTGFDPGITPCQSNQVDGFAAEGVVVGGSAWVFARAELDQRFDYVFIDEAGQVCLANAIAIGVAARSLILIGDQMQLAQPVVAVHPGQSGWSCLHYVLEGHATVPPDRGVLLPTTWRLHPDICRFISDTAYDGRLQPHALTAERCLVPPPDARVLSRGTGIVVDELHHEGNTQSSDEEVERIALIVDELRRSTICDQDGPRGFDAARDLLIVAPYNAQVRCLKERLGDQLRIASVDKFQGQEASVVIVSMCASTLEETPRGAGFLLNPNRLNVALSRARCLAIVVASSTLIRTRPKSVAELELLNLYCRLRFYSRELAAGQVGVAPG